MMRERSSKQFNYKGEKMPTELKPNKDLQGCIESQPDSLALLCSAQLSNARSPDQRWVLLPTALHHTDSLTLILQVIFARVMAV